MQNEVSVGSRGRTGALLAVERCKGCGVCSDPPPRTLTHSMKNPDPPPRTLTLSVKTGRETLRGVSGLCGAPGAAVECFLM
ncbi:hypothetical protein T484DRAFT_1941920 [Baffinella frigidus]|nr:hypothetical protein T484DRAFT_1941920 [Cryptophyta sp. CCMP2293]